MQTIRQAFILLRQNPLLSAIFILGTAFAITMIMAIVITWQMKYADIEPEVNRNRSLYTALRRSVPACCHRTRHYRQSGDNPRR